MYSSEPLPHFVDNYLAGLHETFPTQATFDGVHLHDDLLEDFSRGSIDQHLRELGSYGRRLDAMNPSTLSAVEQAERRMLAANVRGRLHELEEVRTWERNPQYYAETLALSLAAQALFAYAPAEQRARRVLSKLRQASRLVQQARDNVKDPPGIFVKNALETLRGVRAFIERDLPRAFVEVDDLSLLGDLADASTEATTAIDGYAEYLERDLGPRAKGSFRLGKEKFEAKLLHDEGIKLGSERLLQIALRELSDTQEAFRKVASKIDANDPLEVWRAVKTRHPAQGQVVAAARAQVEALEQFVVRQGLVTVPEGPGVVVGPTPPFYRWAFASMWMPGAFEPKPLKSYYYLTDADPAWPADRQAEHLRDFNEAVLWSISMHEVYPGHFLHFQHVRKVASPLRKSVLFAPMSFVEGWAHYAEQMMIEEGFGKKDPALRLGQLAEALIRLARVVVGIRLHTEDMSVEQGVRFFRDEAYLEEASARREAERGTFDPSYVVYTLGKLMLLKLRADVEAARGARFSLREFHDTLLGQGLAPFSFHREIMLPGDTGALLE